MWYLSEHFHQKIKQHAIVIAGTTPHLLIYIFFLVYKVTLYHCCCAAKTVNKQGYIHASYQGAKMAFLSIMNTHFFYR